MEREPSCQPITKMEFEFERRRVTKEDIRELIFREILEYHPQLLKDYMNGTERTNFLYPRLVPIFLGVVNLSLISLCCLKNIGNANTDCSDDISMNGTSVAPP